MVAQEDPTTDIGNENGSVKSQRTVMVQEQQEVASEAEDGQDHEDGGEEVPQEEDEENDGRKQQCINIDGRLF